MIPARLDTLVIFQRSTETVRADGSVDLAWTEFTRARCEVSEQLAGAHQEERGTVARATLTLKTRHIAGLTVADRALVDDLSYDITSLKDIGRRRGLEIKCTRALT